MGAEGFEPTTYAGYLIYSQAPNQFVRYSQLKLSRGEPIFHFLLDSCSLLTMVHTVTTREPNLIFVPPDRIELSPFACKTNTLPLRQGGKFCVFLNRTDKKLGPLSNQLYTHIVK